ncbi:hypothetical protein DFR52_106223 [Hoeflea marina]|uniref:Uncharacterized protein n=1 Tax=Hoeflea marina TaxID=274592 RepID=A0A317PE04_9HYPH|nr:phage major tail tube protein [Hoeflea marina]PWV97698.1 hypothetical protein DFR52_106223 [Hoeflea marina]
MDRIIHGANWYVDTLNQRLRLADITLPALNRAKETLQLGGGFFNLAIPYEIEELEAPFSLNGAHEDIRGLFGREPGDWTTFYYYERLRDIVKGENKGRVVILKGLVNEVTQAKVTGKKGDATGYKVGSIIEYRDIVDGKEIHRFDVFNNHLVIDGVNYSNSHNEIIAA